MSAILKISGQKQNSALAHKDPLDFLILQMFVAKSAFDLAVLIHAYQAIAGSPLTLTQLPDKRLPLWDRALKVLDALNGDPGEVVTAYVRSDVAGAPSTQVTTDWASILPMSDKARSDAAKARAEAGYYKGIRRQPPRDMRGFRPHPVTQIMLSIQKG